MWIGRKKAAYYEELQTRIDVLEENVGDLQTRIDVLEENVRNLNAQLSGYENVLVNIQNINLLLSKLQTTVEMEKVKIAMLEKKTSQAAVHNSAVPESISDAPIEKKVYCGIDYFDFENYFRGDMETIYENQAQYLKYFEGRQNVIDLGCGRGEFLKLLNEHNIDAQGVDFYEEFVELCKMNGLKAACDDAVRFLKRQDRVGGIFAGQLIEHLTTEQLVQLCNIAHDKLEEGASIVMETPNPTCLATYTHAFYMDPSHQKPIHPLTVKYLLEKAGFSRIEIIYTDTSKLPISIPALKLEENAVEFNKAMQMVSELLFGSQDYAIIGTK